METDRSAVLTVRAAVRGVIDFSKADILDVKWWRRSNALISAMARDDEAKSIQAAFSYQLALLGNGQLEEKSFKAVQAEASRLFEALNAALYPWSDVVEGKQQQLSSLIDDYKRLVGDPDDPEFKAKLEADIAADKERRRQATPESDEDRIERLMRTM